MFAQGVAEFNIICQHLLFVKVKVRLALAHSSKDKRLSIDIKRGCHAPHTALATRGLEQEDD